MSSAFTKLFGSVAPLPEDTYWGLYVAPEGKTSVIRDVTAVNTGAALIEQASIRVVAAGGSSWVFLWVGQLASGAAVHVDMRQVMPVGTTLEVHATEPGLHISVTGYELHDS